MKKIIALLLVLAMCFALAACGQTNTAQTNTANTEPANTTNTEPANTVVEDKWPEEDMSIICVFKEGGAIDRVARNAASCLEKSLGVSVIVENIGGSSGVLGTNEYFKRPADGLTLYSTVQPGLSYIHNYMDCEYSVDDFAWINVQEVDYLSIIVPKDSPFKTLQELLDYAYAHPGELTMGHVDPSGSSGFGAFIFKEVMGIDVKPVHYESGGTLRVDVQAGVIDFIVSNAFADYSAFGDDGPRCLAYWADKKLEGIWPDAGPINDIVTPVYNKTLPVMGDSRLIGVNKEFKEQYPERFDKLVKAYQESVLSEENKKVYADLGLSSILQVISPDEAYTAIKAYDSLIEQYGHVLENN